jgi:hypothetical protein
MQNKTAIFIPAGKGGARNFSCPELLNKYINIF